MKPGTRFNHWSLGTEATLGKPRCLPRAHSIECRAMAHDFDHHCSPLILQPESDIRDAVQSNPGPPNERQCEKCGRAGVLVGCFGRKIDGPGLPGGLIIYGPSISPQRTAMLWEGNDFERQNPSESNASARPCLSAARAVAQRSGGKRKAQTARTQQVPNGRLVFFEGNAAFWLALRGNQKQSHQFEWSSQKDTLKWVNGNSAGLKREDGDCGS